MVFIKTLGGKLKMVKINWKLWKISFPFICSSCNTLHSLEREYCEKCGKHKMLRKSLRIDYKLWKRRLE